MDAGWKNIRVHIPNFDHEVPGKAEDAGINDKRSEGYKLWQHITKPDSAPKGQKMERFTARLHQILWERNPMTRERLAAARENYALFNETGELPEGDSQEYIDLMHYMEGVEKKRGGAGSPPQIREREYVYEWLKTGELPKDTEAVKELEKFLYILMDEGSRHPTFKPHSRSPDRLSPGAGSSTGASSDDERSPRSNGSRSSRSSTSGLSDDEKSVLGHPPGSPESGGPDSPK